MACKHLMMALCAVALSSLASVNGKYRISWITNVETSSGTNHWVGFEAFKADGKTKTKWMWPKKSFSRGRYGSAEIDEPSIGDIAKVNLHVQKVWGQHHQDDWNGYQGIISDYETKKTYEFWPGHVDTEGYKKVIVRERQCKDRFKPGSCMPKGSHCGTTSNTEGAFNMAKHDFYACLKSCNFCYPAESDEPNNEEAREDAEPTDDAAPGEHEKKSKSHNDKNEESK
ncbi:uncharacterized protein LOC116308546 [Actinia tenebrosa]|uniref:Uncharacterized protein LOC116308546 n=1 Tax=Actinia tenebrosa TaxID=6105 RepID=A0A6P8JEN2_ACTTE|nr:uncharacterized protein LOC116308546 [Actinia tenebrosa]